MKQRVICDTNIWYNLASGAIKLEDLKDVALIGTFINLRELVYSQNLKSKPEIVRAACGCLIKYAEDIILKDPVMHLVGMQQIVEGSEKKGFGLLNEARNLSLGALISEEVLNKELLEKEALGIEGTNNAMVFLEEIRPRIIDKKSHRANKDYKAIQDFYNVVIGNYTNNEYLLNDNFKWSKVDLLIKTTLEFFQELELSSTMKFKINDWADFFILSYVQPGDKFWTFENKWKRIITQAACGEYLFSL